MTALSERQQFIQWIAEAVHAGARQSQACQMIGITARTLQRWKQPDQAQGDRRQHRTWTPKNKLSCSEIKQIIDLCNQDEFKDLSPHQIVAILAERGQYLASASSLYRILKAHQQLAHRHKSRVPGNPPSKPKALVASAPNQIYSWDITYLASFLKGKFFYLYLFMDIFSRKIVGWQVYEEESSQHASDVIKDICRQEAISKDQVTLHSDNGGPMKGATMLATLQQLGVTPSLSRPAVSNDNPYSESLFKTLKYRPIYPSKPFESLEETRQWVERFVSWYNTEHRHSGIQFVTPDQRHSGDDKAILKIREATYLAAKKANPERWSGEIRQWKWQETVALNPDNQDDKKGNKAA